jgi:adenylate cyclase
VLFVAPDARSAAEVALDTVAAHEEDDDLPSVRAGVASGAVLERLGDVYGEPVNLASRLSDEARPGSVLVDRKAAADLEDAEGLRVRPLERRSVRGFRALSPFLVRRAEPST